MPKIKTIVHPSQLNRSLETNLKSYLQIYSDNLYDQTFGHGRLAVRESWPSSLIQRIVAADISTQLGIGLEYALKKYIIPRGEPVFTRLERLDEDVEFDILRFGRVIHKSYAFPKGDGSPAGEFFSGSALLKAIATLDAAHHLAQQAYLLEPLVLVRSALEVIAWSRACQDLTEGGDYLSITTTQAISQVKERLPPLPRLYGILSKFAHWHPDIHLAFLTTRDGTGVISRSVEYKTSTLIALTTAYALVGTVFFDLMAVLA